MQPTFVSTIDANAFSLKSSITSLICDDFPIQIRSLTGKHTEIKVHHKMRVSELKDMIERADQTPFDQQRLVYNGKQLEDERTLDYYDIKEDTIVHIILRIRGGMFHETSARKDFGLVQCACLQTIEDLEEMIRLLKSDKICSIII
jgi:hypothetical protein